MKPKYVKCSFYVLLPKFCPAFLTANQNLHHRQSRTLWEIDIKIFLVQHFFLTTILQIRTNMESPSWATKEPWYPFRLLSYLPLMLINNHIRYVPARKVKVIHLSGWNFYYKLHFLVPKETHFLVESFEIMHSGKELSVWNFILRRKKNVILGR